MPAASTVFGWLSGSNEAFRPFMEQYSRAKEVQAHALVDDILEISDDGTNDWMERKSESEKGAGVNTGWVLNGEHVQRSRLRVDSRKWFAGKVFPKMYGERVTAEVSGPNGGAIEQVVRWATTSDEGTSDPSAK